jgi:TPP-dependent pyruvate/acetoin dehydrogenase alpha subunit
MAHSAPLFDDAQGYREEDVLERRLERDCLKNFKERLIKEGVTVEELDLVHSETLEYVNAEIAYAVSAPYPNPNELHRGLYE